ncbi:hypothetical protein NPIL_203681, partial [Nephila pilipes]
ADNHTELFWEALEHPEYKPDLKWSGFYIFGPHRNSFQEECFRSDDEEKEATQDFLKHESQ